MLNYYSCSSYSISTAEKVDYCVFKDLIVQPNISDEVDENHTAREAVTDDVGQMFQHCTRPDCCCGQSDRHMALVAANTPTNNNTTATPLPAIKPAEQTLTVSITHIHKNNVRRVSLHAFFNSIPVL